MLHSGIWGSSLFTSGRKSTDGRERNDCWSNCWYMYQAKWVTWAVLDIIVWILIIVVGYAAPTLLKLKTMKGVTADGKPLKIVQRIESHDTTVTFGMCLLQDENGREFSNSLNQYHPRVPSRSQAKKSLQTGLHVMQEKDCKHIET